MPSPVAVDDLEYQVAEDDILRVNAKINSVLENDDDEDGDALAAHLKSFPRNPLINFDTDGTFTYDARYHEDLWIVLADEGAVIDPDLDDDDVYVLTGSGTSGAILLDDGFNSLGGDAFIFEDFTYDVSDGTSTDEGSVRIKITGENDDPEAADDYAVYDQATDTSITIDVLVNDDDVDTWPTADKDNFAIVGLKDATDDVNGPLDEDTDPYTGGLTITTNEGNTVTLQNAVLTDGVLVGGDLEFVAADGFFGIDTFEYTISDPGGLTSTATVRVTVLPDNGAPMADDDAYQVSEDGGAVTPDGTTDTGATVLANDSDPDFEPLGAELVLSIGSALYRVTDASGETTMAGATGTLQSFEADGSFSYDPNDQFEGLDTGESAFVAFDYIAYDGNGEQSQAQAVIEIQGQNDAPSSANVDLKVYEAGLPTIGSGDGNTTITDTKTYVQLDVDIEDVDILFKDPADGDNLYNDTTVVGSYGTLSVNNTTGQVSYTLSSAAPHPSGQGHGEDVTETFYFKAWDGTAFSTTEYTVTVTIVDDINFLEIRPNSGTGATADDIIDDGTADFSSTTNNTATDTFYLNGGADGQTLDVVGIPNTFTLADGRQVMSEVLTDTNGDEYVSGYTLAADGTTKVPFYTLTFDTDANNDGSPFGSYTFTVLQDPPEVVNEIDFSSVKAGGPMEVLTVENIAFDGAFYSSGGDGFQFTDLFDNIQHFTAPNEGEDDVNPNNGGGIGVGNGNIERLETLCIDVTGSTAAISGVRFLLDGVGGGVADNPDIWYVAVKNGVVVASGSVSTTDINGGSEMLADGSVVNGEFVFIRPGVEFDQIYVALDPNDVDGNDKVRINNIATLEQESTDDYLLRFAITSADGDGDRAPYDADANTEAYGFNITLNGDDTLAPIDPGIDLDSGIDLL